MLCRHVAFLFHGSMWHSILVLAFVFWRGVQPGQPLTTNEESGQL